MDPDRLDRPLGAAGRLLVTEQHPAAERAALPVRTRPGVPAAVTELAGVDLPCGRLDVLLDPAATAVRACVDGAEVAALSGDGLLSEPAAALSLVLGGEPAQLLWDVARPGAWARPRALGVRWRTRGWTVLAHTTLRELHAAGRGEGTPLVRLSLDDARGQHRLHWTAAATPREVALAELLVLAHPTRSFTTLRQPRTPR